MNGSGLSVSSFEKFEKIFRRNDVPEGEAVKILLCTLMDRVADLEEKISSLQFKERPSRPVVRMLFPIFKNVEDLLTIPTEFVSFNLFYVR